MGVLKEYDETVNPLRQVVGAAMTVFNEWGAGLLESAYEAGIKHLLEKEHKVERQKHLPIYWKDEKLEEYYRMALVVDDIIVELTQLQRQNLFLIKFQSVFAPLSFQLVDYQ